MKFFQNKASSEAEDEKPRAKVPALEPTPKKRGGGLSGLIDESVSETAVALMKSAQTSKFRTVVSGTEMPVGLVLPVERIGGLDKKASRKDPDKGQMVECIRNDTLQVYAPMQLLEDDCIMFIPTQDTLVAMDEYSFLRSASYSLGAVDANGEVHDLQKEISFVDAMRVSNGEIPFSNFVGNTYDEGSRFVPDESVFDDIPDEEAVPAIPVDADDEDVPFEGGDPAAQRMLDEYIGDDNYDDIPEDVPDESEEFEDEMPGSEYGEEEAYEEEPEEFAPYTEDVTQEVLQRVLSRRFFANDLDLDVNLEVFDLQFLQDSPVPAFATDYNDDWLGGYVRQMAMNGNLELDRIHQNSIARLRENYFNLMSRACEDIQRQLDLDDSSTVYAQRLRRLEQMRNEVSTQAQEIARTRRAEINEEYEARRNMYIQEQMVLLRGQFDAKYSRQRDAKLEAAEASIFAEADMGYQAERRNILEQRRNEAIKLFDYAKSDALAVLTDQYHKYLDDEQAAFERIRGDIQRFVDDNRKDEIARIQVLAEEMERTDAVSRTADDYIARINVMNSEYEAKKAEYERMLESVRQEAEERLALQKREYEDKLLREREHISSMRGELEQTRSMYLSLDERKEKDYQARMESVRAEKDILADKMTHIVETHKHSNMVSAFLVVAILVAALAIGFILGQYVRSKYESDYTDKAIIEQFNERMDEIERQNSLPPAGPSVGGELPQVGETGRQ